MKTLKISLICLCLLCVSTGGLPQIGGASFFMAKITGIYKITSPSGKIYIGQSIDVNKRFSSYRRKNGAREQTHLSNSLKKYGFVNHKFEIIHECLKSDLNYWEIYYIKYYNSFNSKTGLNMKAGGQSGGVNSPEVIAKLRKPKSEETKNKLREAALKRPPISEETREKFRKNMLGNQNLKGKKVFLGRKHSAETRAKLSEIAKRQIKPKGYKRELTPKWIENIQKAAKARIGVPLNASHKANVLKALEKHNIAQSRLIEFNGQSKPLFHWCRELNLDCALMKDRLNKLKWSVEKAFTTPKRKIEFNKPPKIRKIRNLGRILSEETKRKIGQANLGRKRTPEQLEKIREIARKRIGKKQTDEHRAAIASGKARKKQSIGTLAIPFTQTI